MIKFKVTDKGKGVYDYGYEHLTVCEDSGYKLLCSVLATWIKYII